MKKYLLIIQGDTNDGDYIQKSTEFTEEEYEEAKPLIFKMSELIKNVSGHNWGNEYSDESPEELYVEKGLCTEEELERFFDYVPYGEYGVHSIYDVTIYSVSEEINLV